MATNVGTQASEDDYTTHDDVPGSATCVASNADFDLDESVSLDDLRLDVGQFVVVTWPYSR